MIACANKPTQEIAKPVQPGYSPKNLAEMTRKKTFKVAKDEIAVTGALHVYEAMPGALDPMGQPDKRACVYGSTSSKLHKSYLGAKWQLKLLIDGKVAALQTSKITDVTTFDEAGKLKNDPGILMIEACSKGDYPAVKAVRLELRSSKGKKLTDLKWQSPWPWDGVTPVSQPAASTK